MFATRPKRDNPEELDLYVSQHGERFVPADFGFKEEEKLASLDYHIIDVTDEGLVRLCFFVFAFNQDKSIICLLVFQIMVCVNHDHTLSNLYVSARITPYTVEFTLSLERVMYYNPRVTWTDSWLSDTAGDEPFVDVYKVKGLRGIYVASQIAEGTWEHDDIQPQDLISLITFDQVFII